MGQYDCQGVINHLIKAIEKLTADKIGETPPKAQLHIYITRLLFIDPLTGVGLVETEESRFIYLMKL